METVTHDEMLDKYIGMKGSPERDEFDAKVQAAAQEYFIGEAIKEERKRQGLTQAELGERMGVQKSQVSRLENGKGITIASFIKAFKALGAKSATVELGGMGRVALW